MFRISQSFILSFSSPIVFYLSASTKTGVKQTHQFCIGQIASSVFPFLSSFNCQILLSTSCFAYVSLEFVSMIFESWMIVVSLVLCSGLCPILVHWFCFTKFSIIMILRSSCLHFFPHRNTKLWHISPVERYYFLQ